MKDYDLKSKMRRDDRDYDFRRFNHHNAKKALSRDYTAAFFRWSCVRRHVSSNDDVLDVGCGFDHPVLDILTRSRAVGMNTYCGIDACEIKKSNNLRVTLKSDFNFVERWQELLRPEPDRYDAVICFEVIEHMRKEFGEKLLRGCFELLRRGGKMLLSTPVYDGRKQYFNHVHEYTINELLILLEKTGFIIKQRHGTLMNLRFLKKSSGLDEVTADAVRVISNELKKYFDNDALSCIFAPMFPDYARLNVWVCEKE